ncbi:MAG TPA: alpha/beta hydrolase-fold protein [Chitinophagaceae bacterium]|nr:alpha/beta hydrolase-fold protein [Chitinophagaceae bacterium]
MKNYFIIQRFVFAFLALVIVLFGANANAQNNTALKGSVQRVKVHGKSLEGNLDGDSPDRAVSIYLPPGYKKNTTKRYPVVYFLHGYTDSDSQWYGFQKHWINLPHLVDSVFTANSQVSEMIFVTPNAYTKFQGSFYSNSITTGNWEDFIAKELVAYIDSHYRTIAQAASRGLAGHSMGGYGSMRIGQKYPEVFSSVYLLSPCCLLATENNTPQYASRIAAMDSAMNAVKTTADLEKANFFVKAGFATAAAWAPNPSKPPFYLDLPFVNGQRNPVIEAKMAANMPITTLDQYIYNLKQLNGFAFDAGTRDESIAAGLKVLDSALNNYGLKHDFAIYEGDHLNRIGERIVTQLLPFFTTHLSSAATKKSSR